MSILHFFVFLTKDTPIVLGHPWLQKHSPAINRIELWSSLCHKNCLQSAIPPHQTSTSETSEFPDLSNVPSEYHDLHQAFNKKQALSLPPHCLNDCPMDLLPSAPLPSGSLFNLYRKELEAVETYINESLKTGIIRPDLLH